MICQVYILSEMTGKSGLFPVTLSVNLSALGILAFISLATFLPFKDKLFSALYHTMC